MVGCRWDQAAGDRGLGAGDRKATRLPSPGHRPEGLVGGRGAGGEGGLHLHSLLHLNDTVALCSGLMEITYDTGAKVILQGPVTYKVDSAAGGYLSVGKLAARLEKKASSFTSPFESGAGGKGGSQQNTDANSNQSQPAHTLPLSRKRESGPDSPLFTITTPTAHDNRSWHGIRRGSEQ